MRTPFRSLLAALVVVSASIAAAPAQSAPGDYGVFSTLCHFSHANNDDPIVYPGVEGAAHRHHFFGNTSTKYRSRTRSLENHETNCDRPEDKAAYWVPALYNNGVELPFEASHVYYRNSAVTEKSQIVPFPRGLRMIAGTAAHPEAPAGARTAEWACLGSEKVVSDDIPAYCSRQKIIATITFPSCWDGKKLTSTDQSHMAYPWENTNRPRSCPSTHPVELPELTEWVRYFPRTTNMTGITLSSGNGDTMHGDFWNAWEEPKLAQLVTDCLIQGTTCGTVGD